MISICAYQSGVDWQLFVWIDQQKDMSDVCLKKTKKKQHLSEFFSLTRLRATHEINLVNHLSFVC